MLTSRLVAYRIAKPARMPATLERVQRAPGAVADRRDELLDHLHDRAGAGAEQEGGDARVEGRRADPGAEDRRRAGDQRRAARAAARRGGCAATGATIARPSVVLCSAKPITRKAPSDERPDGVGGADREPLAEVVQPDRDRHQQREAAGRRAARPARPSAARVRRAMPARRSAPGRTIDAAEEDERRAAERLRALLGDVEALERGVDREEAEQPDRQRPSGARTQRGSMRRTNGSHSIPSVIGTTPT